CAWLSQRKVPALKTMRFRFYSRNRPERRKFFTQSMAGIVAILAIKFGRRTVTDRRMLRGILFAAVVAAAVGLATFWWLTIPAAVSSDPLPAHTPNLPNGLAAFNAGGCPSCNAVPGQRDRWK